MITEYLPLSIIIFTKTLPNPSGHGSVCKRASLWLIGFFGGLADFLKNQFFTFSIG